MKVHTEYLRVHTQRRYDWVHLTPQVEVCLAITDGKLDLGTWEAVYYGEFDGRREKRVLVKVMGI